MIPAFEGGDLAFLQEIRLGHIHDYSSIAEAMEVVEPPALVVDRLRSIPGYEQATFRQILEGFLRRTGVPRGHLVWEARNSGLIAFEDEEAANPAFRALALYRAITGRRSLAASARFRVCSDSHLLSEITQPF